MDALATLAILLSYWQWAFYGEVGANAGVASVNSMKTLNSLWQIHSQHSLLWVLIKFRRGVVCRRFSIRVGRD